MVSLALEFLQDPYLETLHPLGIFFLPHPHLLHDFLDQLCCKTSEVRHSVWTVFSTRSLSFGLGGFHGFFDNEDGIFSGVIPSGFHDILSLGVPFHAVDLCGVP